MSWVQDRLDESRDFSAGWNSALWEVVKYALDYDDMIPKKWLVEFCRDLAHEPDRNKKEHE